MSEVYFEAVDGYGEPTLWHQEHGKDPQPILSRCDLALRARDLWPLIVKAVTK